MPYPLTDDDVGLVLSHLDAVLPRTVGEIAGRCRFDEETTARCLVVLMHQDRALRCEDGRFIVAPPSQHQTLGYGTEVD